MTQPNFANRTLYHGDNLDFLRGMNSGTIHLIATDPPFNKNKDFHATPDSLAAGASFQDRWSWRDDLHDDLAGPDTEGLSRRMESDDSHRVAGTQPKGRTLDQGKGVEHPARTGAGNPKTEAVAEWEGCFNDY